MYRLDVETAEADKYRNLGYNVIGTTIEYFASPQEMLLHKELGKLGIKHTGGDLQLELIEHNPIRYTYQRIGQVKFPSAEDASLETIRFYAGIALDNQNTGRFDELVDAFQSRRDLMNHTRIDIEDGKNSADVTEHSSLHGVALFRAAKLVALNNPEYVKRSAIVVSKLITRLQAFGGVPAPEALSQMAATYFSVPRTDSIFHSGIDEELAAILNRPMLDAIQNQLVHDGIDAAIAPSGSIDEKVIKDGELSGINMQRMSSGSARLLSKFDRILPGALWLDAPAGRPWYWIGEITGSVKNNPERAHELMNTIADAQSGLARVPVHYREDRPKVAQAAHELLDEVKHVYIRRKTAFEKRREERRKRM